MRVKILQFLHLYFLWEDFKAWRRGETRTAPKGVSGRVYARKDPVVEATPGNARMFSKATAELEIKVTRADGTVEYHNPAVHIEEE